MLIPSYIIAIAALASAVAAFCKRRAEHGITRLFMMGFYIWLQIYPDLPMDTTRLLSRWFLLLLLSVEIISAVLIATRRHSKRRRNGSH